MVSYFDDQEENGCRQGGGKAGEEGRETDDKSGCFGGVEDLKPSTKSPNKTRDPKASNQNGGGETEQVDYRLVCADA